MIALDPVDVTGDLQINLADLRRQLARRLGLLLAGGGALTAWWLLPGQPLRLPGIGVGFVLLLLGMSVRYLATAHLGLARHLLVWGLTALLLLGIVLFAEPWVPFLATTLVFMAAILVPGSEVAVLAACIGLVVWLGQAGRPYPIQGLAGMLGLTTVLAWLTVRALDTAAKWAMVLQERADRLLAQTREHRAELSRNLKSLELAYAIGRRTQSELVQARRQAEDAERMKERFAANISHELRTPLNIILGFSEIMYLSGEVYGPLEWPPALRNDIYQIYTSSRHLLGMIDDVLDLSKYELAGFTLNKESTGFSSFLAGAVSIAGDLFRNCPVQLVVEIPANLPELEIDRTRIRQVLLNLLNNARRFTMAGQVRVEARQEGGEVIVTVADTGPGIPAHKIPLIFDEFYQVDQSLRRDHEGAGLGLAICKRFVEAHQGRIWAESREGIGSTFLFALPIPGGFAPYPYLPSHFERVDPIAPASRPSLLVVDADPAVSSFIQRHLNDYDVRHVESESQLAEAVADLHPQAVLCNAYPGLELRTWQVGAAVPVIECSFPSQAWTARELGALASLTKPVMAEQLLSQVEKVGGVSDLLVVDDDWGFVQLVERMLQGDDKPVLRCAYSGEQGLAAMRARRPDLVLLDLMMPGVDGFQVLDAMRADPVLAGVPVILLTATSYGQEAVALRGQRLVVQRSDGLTPAELLSCLLALLGLLQPHY